MESIEPLLSGVYFHCLSHCFHLGLSCKQRRYSRSVLWLDCCLDGEYVRCALSIGWACYSFYRWLRLPSTSTFAQPTTLPTHIPFPLHPVLTTSLIFPIPTAVTTPPSLTRVIPAAITTSFAPSLVVSILAFLDFIPHDVRIILLFLCILICYSSAHLVWRIVNPRGRTHPQGRSMHSKRQTDPVWIHPATATYWLVVRPDKRTKTPSPTRRQTDQRWMAPARQPASLGAHRRALSATMVCIIDLPHLP